MQNRVSPTIRQWARKEAKNDCVLPALQHDKEPLFLACHTTSGSQVPQTCSVSEDGNGVGGCKDMHAESGKIESLDPLD